MLNHIKHSFHKGDTLIEVMFAVGVFGLAVVGAISLMNRGLATAQNTLEVTMARQEIDTQAEVLRFLQNAYISTKDTLSTEGSCDHPQSYRDLWKCITSDKYTYAHDKITVVDPEFYTRSTAPGANCDQLFRLNGQTSFSIPDKSFILNPRTLGITDIDTSDPANAQASQQAIEGRLSAVISGNSMVTTTGTYPRLIYEASTAIDDTMSDASVDSTGKLITRDSQKALTSAEGIWVTAVASEAGVECVDESSPTGKSIRPDYYDFHIQTCWDSVAGQIASTIGSTVRLFNPDQVSLSSKKNTLTFDNANWEEYGTHTDHSGETQIGSACGNCSACTSNAGVYDYDHVRADTNADGSVNVTFSGYTNYAMNEGIKHTIEGVNHFTLDMDVDTSKINAHPGGTLTISLGPVRAEIGAGGSVKITASNQTETDNSTTFHLLLEKDGVAYKACVGSKCVSTTGSSSEAMIDYNFQHGSHACGCISKVYLTNIMMVNHDGGGSIEDGDCVRYTITPPPVAPPTPSNTFTLTLNANGGSFPANSTNKSASCTTSGTVVPSCVVQVPDAVPTNGNKEFKGWASSPSSTTREYRANDSITLSQDRTIYAVWKDHEEGEGETPTEIENSSIFIVTTWNSSNSDIDSHLTDNNKNWVVYYSHKTQGQQIQSGVYQYQLDVDALQNTNYNSSRDENCNPSGTGGACGDGYIEVTTMRKLVPGTYKFYTHDFARKNLKNRNLTVRVYTGYASAGVGRFPKDRTPIVTLKYDDIMKGYAKYSDVGVSWFVCTIKIESDGKVKVESKKQIIDGSPAEW